MYSMYYFLIFSKVKMYCWLLLMTKYKKRKESVKTTK